MQISRAALLMVAVAATGCVSTHDTQKDGSNPLGGGYWDSEIKKGFFRIDAKSNFAMWADYTGARLTWKFRAEKLCGSSDYEELQVWTLSLLRKLMRMSVGWRSFFTFRTVFSSRATEPTPSTTGESTRLKSP